VRGRGGMGDDEVDEVGVVLVDEGVRGVGWR
jgi:hypothetical protein